MRGCGKKVCAVICECVCVWSSAHTLCFWYFLPIHLCEHTGALQPAAAHSCFFVAGCVDWIRPICQFRGGEALLPCKEYSYDGNMKIVYFKDVDYKLFAALV